MPERTKTHINLEIALASEADANRRYTAYGIRALQEGYPEIAQLFLEVAGAETVHAYSHLLALNAIGTTEENLRRAARGETGEIEQMYPRMIAEAEAEGAHQAAASFRLALEREKYHREMFRQALASLEARRRAEPDTTCPSPPVSGSPSRTTDLRAPQHENHQHSHHAPEKSSQNITTELLVSTALEGQSRSTKPVDRAIPAQRGAGSATVVDRAAAKRGLREMESERERIAWLAGIREVVFGGQDGLISTTTLVAGIAATTSQSLVVLVAGTIAAVAGALSMAVGSYLASRAQRHVYEAELANEQREILEKPGEEMAELLAALIGRGMPRRDAIEVMRRISGHPKLMLDLLGAFELGLTPASLGSPVRDAAVMGVAFVLGSAIPLLPFTVLGVQAGLVAMMFLALVTLFTLGAVKGKFSERSLIFSGLEMVLLGGAAGTFGYALGRLVSSLFGISI